jgi:hypothetical protein
MRITIATDDYDGKELVTIDSRDYQFKARTAERIMLEDRREPPDAAVEERARRIRADIDSKYGTDQVHGLIAMHLATLGYRRS